MPGQVKPIPQGYHTVTPYLSLNDAARALDFYKRAFGAQEIMRMDAPGGKIGHAEIKIGDSVIMLADEMGGSGCKSPQSLGGTTAGLFSMSRTWIPRSTRPFPQVRRWSMPLADMFWGDRYGKLKDPFGHSWSMATHKEDVAPAEMAKRMKEVMAKMGQQTQSAH